MKFARLLVAALFLAAPLAAQNAVDFGGDGTPDDHPKFIITGSPGALGEPLSLADLGPNQYFVIAAKKVTPDEDRDGTKEGIEHYRFYGQTNYWSAKKGEIVWTQPGKSLRGGEVFVATWDPTACRWVSADEYLLQKCGKGIRHGARQVFRRDTSKLMPTLMLAPGFYGDQTLPTCNRGMDTVPATVPAGCEGDLKVETLDPDVSDKGKGPKITMNGEARGHGTVWFQWYNPRTGQWVDEKNGGGKTESVRGELGLSMPIPRPELGQSYQYRLVGQDECGKDVVGDIVTIDMPGRGENRGPSIGRRVAEFALWTLAGVIVAKQIDRGLGWFGRRNRPKVPKTPDAPRGMPPVPGHSPVYRPVDAGPPICLPPPPGTSPTPVGFPPPPGGGTTNPPPGTGFPPPPGGGVNPPPPSGGTPPPPGGGVPPPPPPPPGGRP